MENGILNKLTLLGDRVLIELNTADDHSVTESGIIIAAAELTETDGGRITTRTTSEKRLAKGKVLLMSNKAKEALPELEIGDTVYVPKHVINTTHMFDLERKNIVTNWENNNNIICIPSVNIEAKLV